MDLHTACEVQLKDQLVQGVVMFGPSGVEFAAGGEIGAEIDQNPISNPSCPNLVPRPPISPFITSNIERTNIPNQDKRPVPSVSTSF